MPEFFLELFSEEIPARMQKAAAIELQRRCLHALQFLQPQDDNIFFGARRIAFTAKVNVDDRAGKSDFVESVGPREGAPDAAIDGFLRKHGAERSELITENGKYFLRRKLAPSSAQQTILAELPRFLGSFSWPKSMRWGSGGDFTWIRPLRRVVCLLDGEVIPITLGPVTAGNLTEGHRVHGKGPFEVSSVAVWEERLREHHVIADQGERRAKIAEGIAGEAAKLGLAAAPDDALLDEVTGLVEWPVPLIGKIDPEFMELPPEVRELSMKINQKYFALRNAAGKPAPYFAFVANLAANDHGASIIAGNERVLRARLSDARHFWALDLKTPLDALLPKLGKITFHAKIGTQRQRADRIADLAEQIASALGATPEEAGQAAEAGLLAKADLVTFMVGEFPELQGIMGGYYAARGRSAVVGGAISTHYQPKGPSDDVPFGTVAVSVALADKLDMLREFFAVGEKPTGSGDPFALRRAALGVIRIILENDLRLDLYPLLRPYLASVTSQTADDGKKFQNELNALHDTLFSFIIERLRVKLRGEGKRFDILDAVLAGARADYDLFRIMKKVEALETLINSESGRNLLAAYKRAANILRIENAKDGPHDGIPTFVAPLQEESNFADELTSVLHETSRYMMSEDYNAAIASLARLRGPVDAFFETVTVNADTPELRRNRLRLLSRFTAAVNQVADFSRIEG